MVTPGLSALFACLHWCRSGWKGWHLGTGQVHGTKLSQQSWVPPHPHSPPNSHSNPGFLPTQCFLPANLPKNVLGETVKKYFVPSRSLSTGLFNILCDVWGSPGMGAIYQSHGCFSKASQLLDCDKLAPFFMNHHLYMKEPLTGKLWFLKFGYLVEFS